MARRDLQHPVELGANVAPQLPKLSLDLRAVSKGQVGKEVGQQVETVELVLQHDPAPRAQRGIP